MAAGCSSARSSPRSSSAPDAPADARAHCGCCTALPRRLPDRRPSPAPHQIDARRCISYLTIEHNGPDPGGIPRGDRQPHLRLRRLPGGLPMEPLRRRRARPTRRSCRAPSWPRRALADLLALDDAGFRAMFAGSPIKRIGRNRMVRNCLIAAGNSGDAGACAVSAAAPRRSGPGGRRGRALGARPAAAGF